MSSTTVNNNDQIATCIDGKYYWHNKEVELKKLCSHLPNRDGRTVFSVTLFEPFLFYHDRDLSLKRSQPFVVKLFNNLTSNEQSSSNKIIEYLVTRNPECPIKCKFERLGPENEFSISSINNPKKEETDESSVSKKRKLSNSNSTESTKIGNLIYQNYFTLSQDYYRFLT